MGPIVLGELDSAVEDAIGRGDPGPLRVLGYGEVTLVVGWPPEAPVYAVKRLPRFAGREALEAYATLLARYTAVLAARGVRVVPTEVRSCDSSAGELHAYLVQPLVQRDCLLDVVLRDAPTSVGRPLVREVVAAVARSVDREAGLDAQAANWAVGAGGLASVDVSTPMLRGADGMPRLDLEPFLSVYPYALRPLLRRIARDVMKQFHDPRTVLLDFASNLVKAELERWVPVALEAANEVVAPPLDEHEVHQYFSRDRRLWLLMQRLRRFDRAWQRHVRRRSYGFLLPPPYRYGPPSDWKGHPA